MSVESCQHAKVIQDSATKTKLPQASRFSIAVEQIRVSLNGELIGRADAIDHLLDLRSTVRERPVLVERVDAVLAEVPGQRTVATAWLGVVLTDLERLVSLTGSEANWSVAPATSSVEGAPPPVHRNQPRPL